MSKRIGDESEHPGYPEKSQTIGVDITGEGAYIISREPQITLTRPRYFDELSSEERRKIINRAQERLESGYGKFQLKDTARFRVIIIASTLILMTIILRINAYNNFLNLRYEVYEVISVITILLFIRLFIYYFLLKTDMSIFIRYDKKLRMLKSQR